MAIRGNQGDMVYVMREMREAISGNPDTQWLSVVFSGDQGSSLVISGHQWLSVVIIGHQVAHLYHCATPYSSRNVASTRCPTRAPSHCAGHATASARSKRSTQSITELRLPNGSHVAYSSG